MIEKKKNELTHGMRLILWALSSGPRTTAQIAALTGQCRAGVNDLTRELRIRGLVYQSSSAKKPQGGITPIFSAHVQHPKPVRVSKARKGRTNSRMQSIMDAVKTHPMTAQEIADFIGCNRAQVNSCLTYTRDGGRNSVVFRVAEWIYKDGKGGGWVPAYGPGPSKDAQQPPTTDRKEYLREWSRRNLARERVRASARTENSVMAHNPFSQLIAHAGVTRSAAGIMREAV